MSNSSPSFVTKTLTPLLIRARRGFYSKRPGYGFELDLTGELRIPKSYPFELRPLEPNDLGVLLKVGADMTPQQISFRNNLRRMVHADIARCYVGTAEDGTPCYMQWLIYPDQNEKVQSFFSGLFPPLAEGEVLLENAFTLEPFRGRGINPAAMARLALKAKESGAHRALTYIVADNRASIRASMMAGFKPFTHHASRWLLYRRSVKLEPLAADFVLDPRRRQ